MLRNSSQWYAALTSSISFRESQCVPKDYHRRKKVLLVCLPYGKNPALVSTYPPFSDTCIKGHRSSACKHTDRPLFEIQKKGRPVTQCPHCRELRKTKQVHIKCNCGDARPGKGESASGKFPHITHGPTLQPIRPQLPRKRMIPPFQMESPSPSPPSSL